MTKTALITGAAGFIGAATATVLLHEGWRVIGLDAMTDYYDVTLKEAREAKLIAHPNYRSIHGKVEDEGRLMALFADERPDVVIHLAAQAGVRYSIDNPRSYLESNMIGTYELLEAARAYPPAHMLLASTSSAYGANTVMPYVETARADHQMSFYAALVYLGQGKYGHQHPGLGGLFQQTYATRNILHAQFTRHQQTPENNLGIHFIRFNTFFKPLQRLLAIFLTHAVAYIGHNAVIAQQVIG